MDINGFKEDNSDHIQVVKPNLDVYSVMREIIQDGCQEDPFYICDVSEIIRRHEEWRDAMPRVGTHYAVKCNDSRVVLETLAALGTGFDCASKEEIRKILSLGVHPDRIIFANPSKKVSHLVYAAETKVTMMTFDSKHELHKVKKIYPSAELILRIRYDDLTSRYVLGQKYGCDHETEAGELLELASLLNLNVIGVCFHIGSGSRDCSIFRKAIAAAREIFDKASAMGFKMKLLDIGGGFPGERKKDLNQFGNVINPALEDYFPDHSITVTSEPGRYYANTAFTLTSCIYSMKNTTQTDSVTKKTTKVRVYYVDISVFGGFMSVLFNDFFAMKPLHEDPNASLLPSIVFGPTCHTYDKISEEGTVLPEMNVGDWVVFEEAGAYSMTLSCAFNGFPTPKTHNIINEENWVKLTRDVPYPLSLDRFVLGNERENFKIGLDNSNSCKMDTYLF